MSNSTPTGQVYALVGLTAFLVAIIAAVAVFGDPDALTPMMGAITTLVTTVLGFAFLSNKVKAVSDSASTTAGSVSDLSSTLNGKLDERFAEVHASVASVHARLDGLACPPLSGEIKP